MIEQVITVQKYIRGFLVREEISIEPTLVGKGIINLNLRMRQPSRFYGEEASSLDLDKTHEFMVTRVKLNDDTTLQLVTNQGTPDTFRKYLQKCKADYGAIINGGYYALNGFYGLPQDNPIGLHRFNCNYISGSKKNNIISKPKDNTSHYFKHQDDELSQPCEEYKGTDLPSQLHLKTQTPYSVKSEYGLFRITNEGSADIQKLMDFNHDSFRQYLESAKYLLSSGPFLVWDSEIVFTEEKLEEENYQFESVLKHFGTHPGRVPPGTFYHADQPNPRSGIGFTSDGDLPMVTVKGNEEPSKRDGVTLAQFARLMKVLGAEKALNLDGGYSAFQGIFNPEMYTPSFVKTAGRDKLVPCSIVAQEKALENPPSHHVSKSLESNTDNLSVLRKIMTL